MNANEDAEMPLFQQNPCIISPFASSTKNTSTGENKSKRKFSREKIPTKKNLQDWLRLQQIYHSIKNCDVEEEKSELYVEFGDALCEIGQFTEALCAYGQALMLKKPDQELTHDCLSTFLQSMGKTRNSCDFLIAKKKASSEHPEIIAPPCDTNDCFVAKAGDPCPDPFSCPSCYGVLVEPVTLPCGHTFCREHVMNNPANQSMCLKCKSPWRKEEPRLTLTASGQLERQTSKPEDDLKCISNDTLVNGLVRKYWSIDLKANDIRSKANKFFGSGNYREALKMYNEAFSLAPEDHFILGNRSLTHLKLGDTKAALEDAELAISIRPDWAKGYLRKGMALRLMGQRSEAFKAFFACLSLETINARPVKLELAKELHHLLKTSTSEKMLSPSSSGTSLSTLDSNSFCDSNNKLKASSSNASSLNDLGDFKTSDLPECLQQLGQYLDIISDDEDSAVSLLEELPEELNWIVNPDGQAISKPTRKIPADQVDSTDYECPLCMRLLWKPITTPCGHTFCKTCLDRVLDHNTCCPMCKSATLKLYLSERRETMTNEFVETAMKKVLPEEYSERMKIHESEMQQLAGGQTGLAGTSHVPIFVCTLSFPNIPCPLHVFEPRYRLMIRRCMEIGAREFGMCCAVNSELQYANYGTMLEIRDIQFFPDGRSILDTSGGRRFKVLERSILDGYQTAKVEFLKDDPVDDDNSLEELKKLHDETLQDTKNWLDGSEDTVKAGISVHYGRLPEAEANYWTLPNGPTWAWWILNIFPIDPQIKVSLLSMTSLKKRLENTRRILRILATKSASKRKTNMDE